MIILHLKSGQLYNRTIAIDLLAANISGINKTDRIVNILKNHLYVTYLFHFYYLP